MNSSTAALSVAQKLDEILKPRNRSDAPVPEMLVPTPPAMFLERKDGKVVGFWISMGRVGNARFDRVS